MLGMKHTHRLFSLSQHIFELLVSNWLAESLDKATTTLNKFALNFKFGTLHENSQRSIKHAMDDTVALYIN